ncbi:MAG: rane protein [Thermoleophilaceae bacterium]|nr:rane protein [Thermoleophilaceae bacterium]
MGTPPSRPSGPAQLRGRSWLAALKRTGLEFLEDDLLDWAAALTYYGTLAVFPALIAVVSLLGLIGSPDGTTDVIIEIVNRVAPASVVDALRGPVTSITSNGSAAGILFFVGLGAAILSASGYVGALAKACNVVYETREGRPIWKLKPLQLLTTLVMVVTFTLVVLALVFSGPIVGAVGDTLGIGAQTQALYNYGKWPVLLVLVTAMIAGLYYVSPNVRQRGVRWVLPGSLLAVTVWIAASAGFAAYVANFGSYDKTYGTLGGIITFLVWLWISNAAVLLGAELNAELERGRELEAGVPAEREIQLAARDTPDPPRTA